MRPGSSAGHAANVFKQGIPDTPEDLGRPVGRDLLFPRT
jgi:hypothetical protein